MGSDKVITMKFKIIFAVLVLFALAGVCWAETFTPEEGIFAYKEVEVFEINGINFTIPTYFNVTLENSTEMDFKHDSEQIKISVVDNGKIKKVKSDKSKNLTSSKTMVGSQKGYLVDKNGKFTFSYKEDGKLVTLKSRDMALMIGAIGKD